jgi:predicted RNA-binding Zn ribbon-like protein
MGGTGTDGMTPVVLPTDETEAPGELAVVEAFVNTITYNGGDRPDEELWTDPAVLGRWLHAHGLLEPGERITDEADLERAVAMREDLRELLLANHDVLPPPRGALDRLEKQSQRASLAVVFDDDGHAALRPAGTGMDRALATLSAIVFHAMHDGTWGRLKACRSDTCRWAFYDTSRNRSGKWCSMAICGNRTKVARFRARQEADG